MNTSHGAHLQADLIEQLGRYRVRAAIADGTLHRLWTRVLVDSTRALELPTRAEAALLLHPPSSAIAGMTAAWLHGCTAAESGDIHVLVPPETRSRTRNGLIVHHGPVRPSDVTELRGLRVLTAARATTDVLCTARPRDALAVTDQMLALHPENEREHFRASVAERLKHRPDPRGTRRGARLLELATGRAASPPESWLLHDVVEWGYPPPEVNWPVSTPTGVLLYVLDLAWPQLRIALEYNGFAVHAGREAEDARRTDDLGRRGWIVLVATAEDFSDDARLRRELRKAFTERGYRTNDR
jgi:hypothetical protein